MNTPRVEIDLIKIRHNARTLVQRLKARGITVTGVTKAVRGNPMIAQAMLDGGVDGLADSRVSNLTRLNKSGIDCSKSLIRTPILSQTDQIIQFCDVSFNSEIDVIAELSKAACGSKVKHSVILIVEMGDMREGILPENLVTIASQVMRLPGIELKGIAANFACLNNIHPDIDTMKRFSELANEIEASCGPYVETVSGGNSASLAWAFGTRATGRVNNLRLGEAILLGTDPVTREQIGGLYVDAFSLVVEVIETKDKPNKPLFTFANPALRALHLIPEAAEQSRSILGIGKQDTDIDGLTLPKGSVFLGATSDHMVLHMPSAQLRVGDEVKLQMNYSALMRIMTAPDTSVIFFEDIGKPNVEPTKDNGPFLEVV